MVDILTVVPIWITEGRTLPAIEDIESVQQGTTPYIPYTPYIDVVETSQDRDPSNLSVNGTSLRTNTLMFTDLGNWVIHADCVAYIKSLQDAMALIAVSLEVGRLTSYLA